MKKQKEIIIRPIDPNPDLSDLHFRPEFIFPDETIEALQGLGEILRGIRNRLIREGYTIKDGNIYKNNDNRRCGP